MEKNHEAKSGYLFVVGGIKRIVQNKKRETL